MNIVSSNKEYIIVSAYHRFNDQHHGKNMTINLIKGCECYA